MIGSLIQSPIPFGVPRLIGGDVLFTFGLPFVTEDGFVLLDDDNNALLAASSNANSRPSQPFITEDGFALSDGNNNFLLGV